MTNQFNQSSRIRELKGRVERCCCRYCGSPLELKRITFSHFEDSRIEIFCSKCGRIEYGVEPEIYQSAENFVDNLEFNHYPDLDQNPRTRRMNIAKVCEVMGWGFKNTGLLTEEGFTAPVTCADHSLDQCLIITEDELAAETEA